MSRRDRRVFFGVMLTVVAALTLPQGAARADVVSPPPADCPEGTEPVTCHSGPHCRTLICATNTDCEGGLVCMDRALCVAAPSMYDEQSAASACPDGGACDAGATCSTLKVCVPKASSASGGAGA